MKNLKFLYIKSLKLLLALPFAYLLAIFIWGQLTPKFVWSNLQLQRYVSGQMDKRLAELDTTSNIDILALGSSHTYRSFDPQPFAEAGKKMFNLGSASQSHIQTGLLLRKYFGQGKKQVPPLVLYDVSPEIFASTGAESSIDLLRIGFESDGFIKSVLAEADIRSFNLLLYQKITAPLGLFNPLPESTQSQDEYRSGGFVTYKTDTYSDQTKPVQVDLDINQKQLLAFKRNLDWLADHEAEVILINTPVHPRIKNPNAGSIISEVIDLNAYKFINFSSDENFSSPKLFHDDQHLNNLGAKRFNSVLLSTLDLY